MAAGITTVTPIGGSTVTYMLLRKTNARCQLEFSEDAPLYDVKRFHPPGTDGNIIVRNGLVSGKLTLRVRYHGTIAEVLSNYADDIRLFQNTAVAIVDEDGNSYPRCNLLSMNKLTKPRGYADTVAKAFMDAELTFTRDA